MDRHLSPAEIAKRFGISIKALRLYEQHGLLKPLRTANGATGAAWRAYGPDQVVRLHQILALKRLGLSLARMGELLAGENALDSILAIQERVLGEDSERISRALLLIRKARAKLASGAALSIDDLATLTQETVMTKQATFKELNKIIVPFMQKHLTPEEGVRIREWNAGHPELMNTGKDLMDEAKALMASGDATSAAAMDLARRFRALSNQVKSGQSPAIELAPKLKTMMDDVRSDAEASQKTEVFGFIKKAMAHLKAQEEA
jgi:MerR family transcriptional regulator, thiopeptide resistance regulator